MSGGNYRRDGQNRRSGRLKDRETHGRRGPLQRVAKQTLPVSVLRLRFYGMQSLDLATH
jgi:hypothetical protein